MVYPEHGTQYLEHDDERESWTFTLRASMSSLRGLVQGYCLYEERRNATTFSTGSSGSWYVNAISSLV